MLIVISIRQCNYRAFANIHNSETGNTDDGTVEPLVTGNDILSSMM
jgi:hypothetical protein